MNRSVIPTLLATAVLFAGGLALADDTRLRRFELPNLDTLELTLPPGWVEGTEAAPAGEQPLTIEFAPVEGPDFRAFLTPESSDTGEPAMMDADTLRGEVQQLAERIGPQAVEGSLEIRRLQGQSGVGFYFSATDRVQSPEEYRYMTQGALQTGDLILWFTILTNEGQEAKVAEALTMLQSAVHRATGLDRR
jgi:hypothetical protein